MGSLILLLVMGFAVIAAVSYLALNGFSGFKKSK